jgi:predicted alpha/beta superfamily hydrolase
MNASFMKQQTILLFFVLCSTGLPAQTIQRYSFTSKHTGDTYDVSFKTPSAFDSSKSYKIIVVPDGSLKMGRYILGENKNWCATPPADAVIVAIAHRNGHVMQRQRDFIPSDGLAYSNEKFGQAQKFYLFLKNELLPHVKQKVPHQKMKAFIGHSFSGLFCLYTTLQPDKLFDRHYAISPSVWANGGVLRKLEAAYAKQHKQLSAHIRMWAGTLEVFNLVLSSATAYYNAVKERKYKDCQIRFETIKWANHISILKPAIDKVMLDLK